jgi:hypothetical protein
VKYLLFLFFILSTGAFAQDSYLQLGTGSITPHFGNSKKNYCNQWNDTGIIVNKTYYVRYQSSNLGITYMVGNDSICSPIEGIFFHWVYERYEDWEVGVVFGGYAYEQNNWDKHAEKTPSDIDAPEPIHTKFGGRDVVPVLAIDVGVHLIRGVGWSLKLNNFFTPVIFNHSLALEWQF